MQLHLDGDALSIRMPWWRRFIYVYWGPVPRMPIDSIVWVHPGGPIDLDDAAAVAHLSWRVFANRGLVSNFTDPGAKSRADGGRAFVHRWSRLDSVTVRARPGAAWTTFMVSTRQGEALTAALVHRGIALWGAERA
jgi:hypothetical protein